LPKGRTIVITVTGNGLKDVQWALEGQSTSPLKVIPVDLVAAATALQLA
jgi:threonine synthase